MLHDSGAALFKDFGLLGGPECFTLPQLLAFKCYRDASRREGAGGPGGEFRLTPAEMTVWELRLLHMIGALDPMTTAIPVCPDTASPATRAVYDGIRLLIGLRWRARDWFAGPTALARGFLAAWCGVSEGAAHKAKIWLLKHGILHTKDGGRASRYRGSLFSPGATEKGVRYGKKSADTGTAWISSASSDPSPATSQPTKQQRHAQAESTPVLRPDPADPAASHAERVKSAADRFFKQNGYNVYPTIPFLAAATTLTEAEVEATGLGWLWRQHTTTLSAGCAQGSYRQQE
jgi:hypothetical protein